MYSTKSSSITFPTQASTCPVYIRRPCVNKILVLIQPPMKSKLLSALSCPILSILSQEEVVYLKEPLSFMWASGLGLKVGHRLILIQSMNPESGRMGLRSGIQIGLSYFSSNRRYSWKHPFEYHQSTLCCLSHNYVVFTIK